MLSDEDYLLISERSFDNDRDVANFAYRLGIERASRAPDAATRAVIERLVKAMDALLKPVSELSSIEEGLDESRAALAGARKLLEGDALAQPADEDAWLKEAEKLADDHARATAWKHADNSTDESIDLWLQAKIALRAHLRTRPAREGFVLVPVEQAKDGELFRSLTWRFEEDRDMGPGGRWWVSVSTNDPKIRNDLRKVLIEAAKGDTNADV